MPAGTGLSPSLPSLQCPEGSGDGSERDGDVQQVDIAESRDLKAPRKCSVDRSEEQLEHAGQVGVLDALAADEGV